MAKTKAGKKIVPVKTHVREVNGEPVEVKAHRRSTPNQQSLAFYGDLALIFPSLELLGITAIPRIAVMPDSVKL